MRDQRKSPVQEPVHSPNRTSAPERRGQRHRGPKAQQPAAIRRARQCGDRRDPRHRPSAPDPRSAKLGRKPPLIPLTLRAMLGSRRHPAHGLGQSFFVLLSVLALLAFALFPVAASADSSGAEYENAIPSPTGSHHSTPTVVGGNGDKEGDKAHASNEGGGTPSGGTGSGSSGGSSAGSDPSTGAGNGAGGGKDGNGSTNPQHANDGKDAGGKQVANLEEVPSSGAGSDDGGSSPVVPILIIVALLAAVSVGVVVWQRRRGGTPPATPKAG
jgi:hypothetical protein